MSSLVILRPELNSCANILPGLKVDHEFGVADTEDPSYETKSLLFSVGVVEESDEFVNVTRVVLVIFLSVSHRQWLSV